MLTISSLIAVGLGVALGMTLKTYVPMSNLDREYIGFSGEILIQLLELVTIPLIVTNVITGVSSMMGGTSRKITMRAMVYFISTTLLSVTTGLILVQFVKPGVGLHAGEGDNDESFSTVDALLDLIRNMVPQNIVQATFQQYKTRKVEFEVEEVDENSGLETKRTEVRLVGEHVDGLNTLGLIVCSVTFGLALRFLPIGVLFMTASSVIEVGDNWETALNLGKFMAVVFTGLIIHGVIVLPLMYLVVVRRNPIPVITVFFNR